jgi:predicted TIM-barrel fold metal-dependent hydrolase
MLIVDSQIHLWTGDKAPPHHWRAPFRMEDAIREMDAAGVDAAVNCPAIWDSGANAYAVEAAAAHPDRFATLGWFDLAQPADEGLVERFVAQRGMLGLRFVLYMPQQLSLLSEGRLDWIWASADALGLPVGLMFPPQAYGDVRRIAERFPRMRLLLDHILVGPMEKVDSALERLDDILAFAEFPNVAVKASGVPSMATDDFPFASTEPVLRRTFEAFGPKRMFWGTDFTRMRASWRECVEQFTQELDWLKGEDLEWVMGRGVCDWIGWKRPA